MFPSTVVMMGATGAVGTQVVKALVERTGVTRLRLLGRREFTAIADPKIEQQQVDVLDPESYRRYLPGAEAAVCTLGVGQPSKISRDQFLRIDRDAPRAFAAEVRQAGARHFVLLSSVGVDSSSRSFYLRSKGELEDALRDLRFERLSLVHPSMILTPTNRYGFSQALTLAIWPKLKPLLAGPLRKFRGIEVERLGRAMALLLGCPGDSVEVLEWDEIVAVSGDG